jgi:hypothetical protein
MEDIRYEISFMIEDVHTLVHYCSTDKYIRKVSNNKSFWYRYFKKFHFSLDNINYNNAYRWIQLMYNHNYITGKLNDDITSTYYVNMPMLKILPIIEKYIVVYPIFRHLTASSNILYNNKYVDNALYKTPLDEPFIINKIDLVRCSEHFYIRLCMHHALVDGTIILQNEENIKFCFSLILPEIKEIMTSLIPIMNP